MPSSNVKYVVTIIVLVLFLLGAGGFGYWAFTSRQDYKNNSDKKSAAAVEVAKVAHEKELRKQFDEEKKLPYKTYKGPLTYGEVSFNYPRTWSAMIDETNSSVPINGYFYPEILPPPQSKSAFALRMELLATDYASATSQYDSSIEDGLIKATTYIPPKMAAVQGVQPGLRLDGEIVTGFQGSMVLIKVRDKTLQISTQSNEFLKDFNETVLASLTFVP